MNILNRGNQTPRHKIIIGALALLPAVFLLCPTPAFAHTNPPVLQIARAGTNEFAIAVSNGIPAVRYEIQWTPAPASANYPWTVAVPGNIGQTNFLLTNWEYPTVLFRGVLDNFNPPLWENATPNNPGTNLLKVTIASPANGSSLN